MPYKLSEVPDTNLKLAIEGYIYWRMHVLRTADGGLTLDQAITATVHPLRDGALPPAMEGWLTQIYDRVVSDIGE